MHPQTLPPEAPLREPAAEDADPERRPRVLEIISSPRRMVPGRNGRRARHPSPGGAVLRDGAASSPPSPPAPALAHGPGAPEARRPLALHLPRARTGRLIASLGPWLASGNTVFCLDGGNAFNPSHLARQLRARGEPADEVFEERLFVSRAWTCHQLAFAAEEMLPPLLARRPVPLVVLLGIETMFLDEDIALFERRHLFEQILARSARLCGEGLPLLITCGENETPWSRRIGRCARLISAPEIALGMIEGEAATRSGK